MAATARDGRDDSGRVIPGALSRRELLAGTAGAISLLALSRAAPSAAAFTAPAVRLPPPPRRADEDALDAAFARLQEGDWHNRGGLSSHAPMAVEALAALGAGAAISGWIEQFARNARPVELPQPRERIDVEQWRRHVGLVQPESSSWDRANARYGDWLVHFTEQLRERPWRELLATWAPRFAPGFCAAAMHGVIRTAHAARALQRRESPPRLAELARGLAYWASSFQELGTGSGDGGRESAAVPATLAAALAAVPLHREQKGDAPRGNLVEGLRAAGSLPGCPDAVTIAELAGDPSRAIMAMTATMARAYLRHGTRRHAIAFVHAVTGPAALRKLSAVLPPEAASTLVPYAWQAAIGLYSAYAATDRETGELAIAAEGTPATLAANAAEATDAHVIKFTEALLAEHAVHADPAYLAAAEDIPQRF